MIVCPVCEHQQAQGFTCDVCGKDLGAALGGSDVLTPLEPEIARMPELETYIQTTVDVQVQRMPDLETYMQTTVDVQVQPIPDLETYKLDVGEVPVQRMIELDAAEPEAPMPRVKCSFCGSLKEQYAVCDKCGTVQCRYCGNAQSKGSICEKCGMRLPGANVAPAIVGPPPEPVQCKHCGTLGIAGERCKGPECGHVVEPRV
jgi:hypothetical protein